MKKQHLPKSFWLDLCLTKTLSVFIMSKLEKTLDFFITKK